MCFYCSHHTYQLKDDHCWTKVRQTNRLCTICIHRIPATITRSSFHLFEGLPTLHLPVVPIRIRHLVATFSLHWSLLLWAMCPAHCHSSLAIECILYQCFLSYLRLTAKQKRLACKPAGHWTLYTENWTCSWACVDFLFFFKYYKAYIEFQI